MRVLVTDGEQRAALAVVRSLASVGHTVFVSAAQTRSIAGASRHCHRHASVPSPLREPTAYLATVRELLRRWNIDALIPISEPSLLALLPLRELEPHLRIPFVDGEHFSRICDKVAVAEAAESVGISVPRQVVAENAAAIPAVLEAQAAYPVVVKPARSVVSHNGVRQKLGVIHAADRDSLRSILEALAPSAWPVLIQQRIVGPGVGVFLLIREGRVAAAFAHRRIREKPVTGGVSVFRESIALDPDLLSRSHALLAAFDWEGVAMVEYKIDALTGEPYIMEINGRFWGSLQLAIDAGVDFPVLLLADDPDHPGAYRIGVRSRWEWGEVDHLIARLRQPGAGSPDLHTGRLHAVLEQLASFQPGNRLEVFRIADPAPFLVESMAWLLGVMRAGEV